MTQDADQSSGLIVPCPDQSPGHRITLRMLGEDGMGLSNIAVELRDRASQRVTGKTSVDGEWTFDGLREDSYSLCFPGLDEDAWELVDNHPLQNENTTPARKDWKPVEPTVDESRVHTLQAGDCIASVAAMAGLFPDTLWQHPNNQDLRTRRESPYILAIGDELFIPARRLRLIDEVNVDSLVTVRRKGVPERLQLRFLHSDGTPRAYVMYHLHLEAGDSDASLDKTGVTNADGLVCEWIAPTARTGRLTLIEALFHEVHLLDLGALAPLSEPQGHAQRLANLAYLKDGETLETGIKRFQDAQALSPSGLADEATLNAMKETFRC